MKWSLKSQLPRVTLCAIATLCAIGTLASAALPVVAASRQGKIRRRDQKINDSAARQIKLIADEKRARTPAQKKIDSQLLYALKQKRGDKRGVPTQRIKLKLDDSGRALVDITAIISPRLSSQIRKLGGMVISKSETYHTIRAMIALEKLEELAAMSEVRFIAPAGEAMTHGARTN